MITTISKHEGSYVKIGNIASQLNGCIFIFFTLPMNLINRLKNITFSTSKLEQGIKENKMLKSTCDTAH